MRHPGPHRGGIRADGNRAFELLLRLTEASRLQVVSLGLAVYVFLTSLDWLSGPMFRPTVGYVLLILAVAWMGRRFDAVGFGVGVMGFDEFVRHAHPHASAQATAGSEMWTLLMSLLTVLVLVHVTSEFRDSILVLRRQARVDPLTGVLNTEAFKQEAQRERDRAVRERHPVSLAFLDLDHLKVLNDRLGHTGGDRIIRTFAAALESAVRPYDLVGRLGGDEFAVFLPGTDEFAAAGIVARLRSRIAALDDAGFIGVSVGLATYYSQPGHVREMIAAADSLMYEAKRSGRNRTVGRVVLPRSKPTDAAVVVDVAREQVAHHRVAGRGWPPSL